MADTADFDNEIRQRLEEKRKEIEKRRAQLLKRKTEGIINCHFCGSVAIFLAVKTDGKKIPCCRECIYPKTTRIPWLAAIENI